MAMTRAHDELEAKNAPHPRTAQFRSTLVLAWPDGHDEVFEGVACPVSLSGPSAGKVGLAMTQCLSPTGHDITFAEMDRWEKNKISHRGRAVDDVRERLFWRMIGATGALACMCTGPFARPSAPIAISTAMFRQKY